MKPSELKHREAKILAVGILLAVLGLLIVLLVVPLAQRMIVSYQTVGDGSFRVARLQAAVAQLPDLQAQVAALEVARAQQDLMWREPSESLAAASLQQRVSRIVGEHNGDLQSTRVQAAVVDETLHRISIRVQMRADAATLGAILAEFESARPLLFVGNLSVRAEREHLRGRRADYLGTTEVVLDLSTYWRPEDRSGTIADGAP